MGVAGFFKWLMERYPSVCRSAGSGLTPLFDCFFIDFNCIIHRAIRATEGGSDENQMELVAEILRFTDSLIQIIRPTKLLYIAVDGPAPFAKSVQQRQRRFTGKAGSESSAGFTKNSISVGTSFMEYLHQRITKFIQDRMENDEVWSTPKVIYSSHHTPGEGEHKIFDFIRAQRKAGTWNENYSCCVYSPDADLIFVCLYSHIKNFCVMKDSDMTTGERAIFNVKNDSGVRFSPDDFSLVYIQLIRELILVDFLDGDDKDLSRVTDDFCAISFLLGNDFIPHFPDFSIQKGQFNIALDVYQRNFLSKRIFLIENEQFNYHNLGLFLGDVSVICAQLSNSSQTKESVYNYAIDNFFRRMDKPKPEEMNELLAKSAFVALDSFTWVLRYYTYGCPSWTWSFPAIAAPALIIISKFADSYKPSFVLGVPPTPVECLMSLLPAKSVGLLPAPLQKYADVGSPLYDIFNGSSKGVSYDDLMRIKETIKKEEANFTEEEKQRNVIMKPFEIRQFSMKQIDDEESVSLPKGTTYEKNPPGMPSYFSLNHKITIAQKPPVTRENTPLLIYADVADNVASLVPSFEVLKGLVGKVVLVDFPFLVPAQVKDVLNMKKENTSMHEKLRSRCNANGFEAPKECIVIEARPLIHTDVRHTKLAWSEETYFYPFAQTAPVGLFPILSCINETFRKRASRNMPGVVTRGQHSGNLCKIVSINEDTFTVKLIQRSFSRQIKKTFDDDKNRWFSIPDVSKKLSIPVSSISISLNKISTPRYGRNIGLAVIKQTKAAEGYVKRQGKNIFITAPLIPVIKDYFEKIGALKEVMNNSTEKNFNENYVLFLESLGDDAEQFTIDISQWVKANSPGYHAPMSLIFHSSVAAETMQKVEEEIEKMDVPDVEGKTVVVPQDSVIWPGKNIRFYDVRPPNRCDHVVFIGYKGIVPFGTTGTVLSSFCRGQVCQVIADKEFDFGSTMVDQFRKRRVFIAYSSDLFPF